MKTRIIILSLVVSAVITLSFTVIKSTNKTSTTSAKTDTSAPVGGFVAEEKL